MDRSQLAPNLIDSQEATQVDQAYPSLSIAYNENLHDSQYSVTQRTDRIKKMIKDMAEAGINASQQFCDTQPDSTQPDGTQHDFTQPDITQHSTLANYGSVLSIKSGENMLIEENPRTSSTDRKQGSRSRSDGTQTTAPSTERRSEQFNSANAGNILQPVSRFEPSNIEVRSQSDKTNLGKRAAPYQIAPFNTASNKTREQYAEGVRSSQQHAQWIDAQLIHFAKLNKDIAQFIISHSQKTLGSNLYDQARKSISPSVNEEGSNPEYDAVSNAGQVEDEEGKEARKTTQKKGQSHLKNIPGHIMLAIQKGCRYYFNTARRHKAKEGGRSGQLNLKCISHVLRRQEQYIQEKFEKFIEAYDTAWMTWITILKYIKQYNDKDLIKVLQEMVEELFANENKADLENWLEKSKMAPEMKDKIRAEKNKLQGDFMDRLEKV